MIQEIRASVKAVRAVTAAMDESLLSNPEMQESLAALRMMEYCLARIDRMRETMVLRRAENADLKQLAWSVREWFVLKDHENAEILVETLAEVELDVQKALAVHFGTARRPCPEETE